MDWNNNKVILAILVLVIGASLITWYNLGQTNTLGSDSNGQITKVVYNHYGTPKVKIAVITGMHPREDLSTNVVPYMIKLFAMLNVVEVADYHVKVINNPNDFYIGRSSGEALVAEYAVPDIKKSEYQLVIIAHDHEPGYGEGYYIATPTGDQASVSLGESVQKLLPSFNFYTASASAKKKATSIKNVDKPLTDYGIPVFVYEMPEESPIWDAAYWTYKLFGASYQSL
jgi:hypothetical protein